MSEMSGVAESGRKTGWKSRLVWIALALSLVLNVFFVAGGIWVKMSVRSALPPIVRLQRLGDRLDLNEDQRVAFDQFIRVIRLHGRFVRETNQPLLDRIWIELAKRTPDEDAVGKLGAQVGDNRQAFMKEVSVSFFAFVKTLSPEQREKLSTIARRANDPPTRRLFEVIAP